MPNTNTPSINSEVAIGRRIKGSEMLIGGCSQSQKRGFQPARLPRGSGSSRLLRPLALMGEHRLAFARKRFRHTRRTIGAPDPTREAFEIEVDDRRRVERQPLRNCQPADDGDTERPAQLGAGPLAECDWQTAEQCR